MLTLALIGSVSSLLGLIVAVAGLAITIKKPTLRFAVIGAFTVVIISLVSTFIVGVLLTTKPSALALDLPPAIENITLTITKPNSSLVSWEVFPEGDYDNVPPGWKIWVLVHPVGTGLWYPQEPVVASQGHWHTRALIGLKTKDRGKNFDIGVILANVKDSVELSKYVGHRGIDLTAYFFQIITVTRQ